MSPKKNIICDQILLWIIYVSLHREFCEIYCKQYR